METFLYVLQNHNSPFFQVQPPPPKTVAQVQAEAKLVAGPPNYFMETMKTAGMYTGGGPFFLLFF